jgi:hypothetical protein
VTSVPFRLILEIFRRPSVVSVNELGELGGCSALKLLACPVLISPSEVCVFLDLMAAAGSSDAQAALRLCSEKHRSDKTVGLVDIFALCPQHPPKSLMIFPHRKQAIFKQEKADFRRLFGVLLRSAADSSSPVLDLILNAPKQFPKMAAEPFQRYALMKFSNLCAAKLVTFDEVLARLDAQKWLESQISFENGCHEHLMNQIVTQNSCKDKELSFRGLVVQFTMPMSPEMNQYCQFLAVRCASSRRMKGGEFCAGRLRLLIKMAIGTRILAVADFVHELKAMFEQDFASYLGTILADIDAADPVPAREKFFEAFFVWYKYFRTIKNDGSLASRLCTAYGEIWSFIRATILDKEAPEERAELNEWLTRRG